MALDLELEDSASNTSYSLHHLKENTAELVKDVTMEAVNRSKFIIHTSLNPCSNLSLFLETNHEDVQHQHRQRSATFYHTATVPCRDASVLESPMMAVASGASLALSLACATLALLLCWWHRRVEHVVKEEVNATYGQEGGDYQESTVSDTNDYYKK